MTVGQVVIVVVFALIFLGWLGNLGQNSGMNAEQHRRAAERAAQAAMRTRGVRTKTRALSQAEAHLIAAEEYERRTKG